MDKLLAAADWPAMQREMARRRAAGELAGAGFAMFVEKSGLGPFDKVRIEVSPGGSIEVVTGVASIGQGVETAMAQIAAETLGIDYAGIKVTHGQTDRIDKGLGAFASRVTVMCGEATRMAADKLREEALRAAAELMQTSPDTLDIVDGEIVRMGASGPSMSLAALAAQKDGLRAEAEFKSSHMVYPYGAHVVQLRLDADTGGVVIERYLVAFDIGRAVNPMLVEGQITGGLAQGLGGALYEEFMYSDTGEPLAVTFADYLMPAAAVDDALQRHGAVTQLPITPQRLKAMISGR
jgi:CO/xanthine dehydrogenase Mo-binding subunit